MTDRKLAGVAACIIVLGHLALFLYAFVVLIAGVGFLKPIQIFLVIMMAAPLSLLVGHSAFDYVVKNRTAAKKGPAATWVAATFVLTVPSIAVAGLATVYTLAFFSQVDMTNIGIYLASIEVGTSFYLGRIKDEMFSL